MRSLKLCTLLAINLLSLEVAADCECGYSVNNTVKDPNSALFTSLGETDFLHLTSINANIGWQPQAYNVSASAARGPYGKSAQVANVVPNPLKDAGSWDGEALLGGDPGLQMWVRGQSISDDASIPRDKDRLVPMAEINSQRGDFLYGSFRAGIKYSNVSGTCGAWFWYRNDSQEIDMELLSREFNTDNSTVNLVLQSPAAIQAGFNAAGTNSFDMFHLMYNPSEGFHEYRFDWLPDRVEFYIDGQLLRTMTQSLPNGPGRLMLNHWSNGDPGWSGGPPQKDAVATIMYLKAYFNASTARPAYREQCAAYDPTKICQIPAQTKAPALVDKNTPPTFLFSAQNGKTSGQNTEATNATWDAHGQHNAAMSLRSPLHDTSTRLLLLLGGLVSILMTFTLS